MAADRQESPQPRMYTEFARYWPLISTRESYAREAEYWRDALRKRLGPGRHRVLELGVGGGHNMSHLTGEFQFTAADLSPAMAEQARKTNPGVEVLVGDMRTIRLGRRFDAVLIHDAISYMATEADLRAAFATAAAHLDPGGVFVIAPDFYRETFRDPTLWTGTNCSGDVEVSVFEYTYDPDPTDTSYETLMWYLIRQRGGPPRVEQDRHVMGLFPLATWERLMVEAGFRFEKDPYNVHGGGRESYLLVGIDNTSDGPRFLKEQPP